MVLFSLNVNKIALLRNSRGSDYPNLVTMAKRAIDVGVKGITVHPRPDQRHIRYDDVPALAALIKDYPSVEFNIEGYPNEAFLELVYAAQPTQCTLVPDEPGQLTSDHGWDVPVHVQRLKTVLSELRQRGIRSALFMDAEADAMQHAAAVGADRIELYTEDYARAHGTSRAPEVLAQYAAASDAAKEAGLLVNAGHDLNLGNLADLLAACPAIEEVSIGHAVMVETFDYGFESTLKQYLAIVSAVAQS